MSDTALSCAVVRDLLPLYVDGVTSEETAQLVKKHLDKCADCRALLADLEESPTEAAFAEDGQAVLLRHRRKERSLAMMMGTVLAMLLIIPMVTVFIVTLSGESDWATFAVIAASLFLVAGLTVVPLWAKGKRFTKAVLVSMAALMLVIFFIEMFFGDGWLSFVQIAASVMFALSLFLMPPLLYQAELPEPLAHHKGLVAMCWDSVWFLLMMGGLFFAPGGTAAVILPACAYGLAYAWSCFAILRYLPLTLWARLGLAIGLSGVWLWLGERWGFAQDLGTMSFLIGSLTVGAVLVLIGVIWRVIFGRKGKRHD